MVARRWSWGLWLCLSIWCLASSASAQQLAFPTAQGAGRLAKGGRGGHAYLINSLSNGTGSGGSCNAGGCGGSAPFSAGTVTFKDCLDDRFSVGARTCVFRVGGTINYGTGVQHQIRVPNITIAGQTAPGDGILIRGAEVTSVLTHDVIVRHLRVRHGQMSSTSSMGGLESSSSHDIMYDHCSISWGPDDQISAGDYDGADEYNVTYQWCIVTEGVGEFDGSDQSKIGILADFVREADQFSAVHNLFANSTYRFPNVFAGTLQLVNNIIYNSQSSPTLLGSPDGRDPVHVDAIKNYYKVGPDSNAGSNSPYISTGSCTPTSCATQAASTIYALDNFHSTLRPTGAEPQYALVIPQGGASQWPRASTRNPALPVITDETSAAQARTDVLAKAGAYAVADGVYATVRRDSIDQRAVNDVINTTGRIITNESAVGGYPTYNNGTPYTDTDGDGIADAWETAHGLNPNNAADGPALAAGQPAGGYTNLEVFLNALAGDAAPFASAPPTIAITAPTGSPTYPTTTTPLTTVAGTAGDDVGIPPGGITWTCPTCSTTSGTATCTGCNSTTTSGITWSIASLGVAAGSNVLTVQAMDTEGQPTQATLTIILPPIRLNAGGPQATVPEGTYSADAFFVGGSTVDHGAVAIAGTTDDTIYQTERYGTSFSYAIPVANGTYDVTLRFAEHTLGAGQRTFNVDIEGARVLTNFDIFSQAGGGATAVDRTFTTTVSDGVLTVVFTGVADDAQVNALKVVTAAGNAPPVVTITQPTASPTYATSTTPLTPALSGTATDDVGVTGVTWACPTCSPTSGTATCASCGASAVSVSWSVASIGLASGSNVITVTGNDGTLTGTDVLTVTYTPSTLAPTVLRLVK
jgi:pectate lyase